RIGQLPSRDWTCAWRSTRGGSKPRMAVSDTPLIVDSCLPSALKRGKSRWAARTDNNYNKALQRPLTRARPTSMRLRKHPLVVAAVMAAVLACAGVLLALRVAD